MIPMGFSPEVSVRPFPPSSAPEYVSFSAHAQPDTLQTYDLPHKPPPVYISGSALPMFSQTLSIPAFPSQLPRRFHEVPAPEVPHNPYE